MDTNTPRNFRREKHLAKSRASFKKSNEKKRLRKLEAIEKARGLLSVEEWRKGRRESGEIE